MRKVLFIDRDGTLIEEPADFQVDSFEKLKPVPGVIRALSEIVDSAEYELVMVTNQDGLGTPSFPEADFLPVHERLLEILAGEGIKFADILIDRSFARENLPTRKPNIGLATKYIEGDYDLANSFVIGDRGTDVEFARNLGANAIFLKSGRFSLPDDEPHLALVAENWAEISRFLTQPPRRVVRNRKTSETEVLVTLDLEGNGNTQVSTGLAFFDHMLEQLGKHGGFDLEISARGDLHIDEHHTVEDVAITLGEALDEALGEKRGIGRYGFTLPMDDCLAQVALDLGGRSWVVWDAEFRREKIGDMPTEMFFHFFKSFADNARCNLNIKAEGTNEHHKIESIFKAFARSLKQACSRNGDQIPSTKGVVWPR